MIKKALITLLILFFLFVVTLGSFVGWGVYHRDTLLKEALTAAVTEITGFKTHIDSLHHEWPGHFRLEGITLYNPVSFEEPVFAVASRINIVVNLPDLYQERKLHLSLVHVDLDEIYIEKRKDGITNVKLLKTIAKQNLGISDDKPAGGPSSVFLDRLEIVSKRIVYRDLTGVLPKKFVTDLKGKEKVFMGLPDSDMLVNIIIAETTKEGKIDSVVLGLGPIFFERSLKSFAGKGKTVTKKTADVFVEGAEVVVKKAPEVFGEKAEEVLKATAEGVKDVTKAPLEIFEKKKTKEPVSTAADQPKLQESEEKPVPA